jgi:hypothetical protein
LNTKLEPERRNAMRLFVLIPTLAVSLALVSCIQVSSSRTSPARYAAVPEQSVYVFQTLAEVPQPYENVGIIYTKSNAAMNHEGIAVDKTKKKAGMMGANAVVLNPFTEPSSGAQIAGAIFGVPSYRKGQAVALRFDPSKLKRVP